MKSPQKIDLLEKRDRRQPLTRTDGLVITSFDVKDACFMSFRHNKPTQLGSYIKRDPLLLAVSFIASRSSFRTTVRGSSIARLGTKQAKGLGA
jgi:hypothetical protein